MGRTLLDLFNNQPLARADGKTASEQYEVRDSKKIPWSSANPLVQNTGIRIANEARSRLGNRTEETLVEQETTGIRVVRAASTPAIYGTELGRLTLETTRTKDRMLRSSVGEQSDFGILGSQVERIRDGIDLVKSKLGFPNRAIPTYVVDRLETSDYNLSLTQNRDNQLRKILNESDGTAVGNLLNNSISFGTPTDIGRNIIGGVIREVKSSITDSLFGSGTRYRVGAEDNQLTGRNLQAYTRDSSLWYGKINVNYGSIRETTGIQIDTDPSTAVNRQLDKGGVRYSSTITKEGDDTNDLSTKQVLGGFPSNLSEIRYSIPSNIIQRQRKFADNIESRQIGSDEFIQNKRGIRNHFDATNISEVYDNDIERLEDADFITLKFKSKGSNKLAYFRATISGLSETFSPSWDSGQFIGNPFSFYTYTGIERSVSFNFTVFSLSAREHKRSWERLNFLSSLVYPERYYENSTAVQAPFIEFTLGDMYRNKDAFIESLSFEIDDNFPWETNLGQGQYVSNVLPSGERVLENEDLDNYKLPMLVNVSIGLKFLESRSTTESKKFYSFNPQNV